ncbi:TetR/AcrR family transcriptional regulator [Neobacillus dielmonensis]|uniref:TetR/AcrR family transcriptional regulator n=1 Tax=Neobacillus dielmonensis TaxID=1347369 RepID=UPI0005A65CB9|nr:TetR/AcrR family transcriptional regulator [Neobacillus dielmonensis]
MKDTPAISAEKIIEEASKLFFKNGYRNTSMKEIALQLNVTHPAIYYYFKSKDEILETILKNVLNRAETYLSKILSLKQPAHEKFHMIVEQHTLAILDNKIEMGIFFEEQKNLPGSITQETVKRINQYYQTITGVYREAMDQGYFANIDPPVAVQLILGLCNWTYKWFSPKGKYNKEQISQFVSALLKNGYFNE